MAKAGATYGMSLLWTIAASCMATFFMISVYGRYTMVTGETALYAFRKHIHSGVAIYFIIALSAGVTGSVMGVMGIVADVCHEWSKTIFDQGIDQIWFAAFFVTLVYAIFWNGRTQAFERSLAVIVAVIVAVMAMCFLVNFLFTMPPLSDVLRGMIPSLPNTGGGEEKAPYLVIASMVGTTVFSGLFIIRTTLVKEAGWTMKDRHRQRNDALVSALMMFLISAAIMGSAAGTLYVRGVGLTDAAGMIKLLEPIAGSLATSLFAVGIIAAGVSSQFPNVLMLPWLLCDFDQSPRDMTLTKYRVIVLIISLFGLVVPIFSARPLVVMIVSQVLQSLMLPATVACIIYLGNRRDLMGDDHHSRAVNAILIAILLFSLVTTTMGIQGVWQLVTA